MATKYLNRSLYFKHNGNHYLYSVRGLIKSFKCNMNDITQQEWVIAHKQHLESKVTA